MGAVTDILRIEATLLGTGIRRVLQLDGSMSLLRLNDVLQIAFGWEDRHLHEFRDDERMATEALRWGDAESLAEGLEGLLETEWSAAAAFGATGGTLYYGYDFGDNWTHRLELLATRPALDGEPIARVIEGERGAAIEDAGGTRGYELLIASWHDPAHPEHAVTRNMVGPWRHFTPDSFDIDSVNDELAGLDPATAPRPLMPAFVSGIDAGDDMVFRRLIAPLRRGSRPDAAELARYLHPYLWFIERIGDAGVPVTEAGWIQPALVREVMDALGWSARFPGTVRSESSTPPVRLLKENLRQLGLVRKYRGRLLPQAKTAAIVATPEGLWSYLAEAVGRLGSPAEVEAGLLYAVEVALGRDSAGMNERIAFGLAVLGWQLRGEEWPTAADAAELTRPIRRIFAELGEPAAPRMAGEPSATARAFARAIVLAAP